MAAIQKHHHARIANVDLVTTQEMAAERAAMVTFTAMNDRKLATAYTANLVDMSLYAKANTEEVIQEQT